MQLINEEEGGIHKRYASPLLRDRTTQQQKHSSAVAGVTQSASAGSQLVTVGPTPIVPMERTSSILPAQRAPADRSLESVLQASQQQVNAIETMLKGMDVSEKNDLSSGRTNGKDQGDKLHRYFFITNIYECILALFYIALHLCT